MDEETFLTLKYFSPLSNDQPPLKINKEKKQDKIDAAATCGSLYDYFDPNHGVSVRENKKVKKYRGEQMKINGKWVRKEFLERFKNQGQRIYGDVDNLQLQLL